MRHASHVITLAGLASAAQAAGVTLTFRAAATTAVRPGELLHWTVSATFTGVVPGGYFGGFVGTFDALTPEIGTAVNLTPRMAGVGVTPGADGAGVVDINIFNAALLGTDDPSNPITIFEFDVLMGPDSYGVPLSYDATGVASLFLDGGIFTQPTQLFDDDPAGSFAVVSDTYFWIPAPGAAALLAPALLAVRRRRTERRFN